MEIKFDGALQKIEIKPSDKFLLKLNFKLTNEQAEVLRESLKQALP